MTTKKVTVYFKPQQHEDFKQACRDNDVTMAAKLLEMAKGYTKRNKIN